MASGLLKQAKARQLQRAGDADHDPADTATPAVPVVPSQPDVPPVPAAPDELQPATVDVRSVPVGQVAANPRNTRDVRRRPAAIADLGKSMRAIGQLQAAPVVTLEAFLAIFPPADFPGEAKAVGNSVYVQVNGACRRAAATVEGLPLDIVVRNDLAESREKFIEATLAENLDRQLLDPVEEALAVEQMVMEYGATPDGDPVRGAIAAVARRRQKSDAWVHQALNLVKLEPEVQEALRADDPEPRLPTSHVRTWYNKQVQLSREQQLEKLEAWRRRQDPAEKKKPAATKVTRTRTLIMKLGPTNAESARAVRTELSPGERRIWIEELSRDDDPAES